MTIRTTSTVTFARWLGSFFLALALAAPGIAQNNSLREPKVTQTIQQQREEQQEAARQERLRRNRMATAARQLETRGNNESALKLYRDLLEADPNRHDYFEGVIRNLVALTRFDEAVSLLEAEVQNPRGLRNEASLYAELGAVYHQAGQEELASLTWQKAIRTTPGSTIGYQTVASSMIRLRLLDRAEEVLRRGRADLGDSTLFSVNLATLLQARMEWDGAAREYLTSLQTSKNRISYIERAIAGFPDSPEAETAVERVLQDEIKRVDIEGEPWQGYSNELLQILVGHYTSTSSFSKALDVIIELDEASPNPGYRLLDFAGEASQEGFPDVARRALELAAERFKDPEGTAVANLTLAGIAQQDGNGEVADSLLSLLLEDPVSSRVERAARYQRGLVRLDLLENPEAAAKDFKSLLVVPDPTTQERLRFLYAFSLARLDSLEQALGQLGKVGEQVASKIQPPPLPGQDAGWLLEEADAAFLEARIAMWLGRPATASERIEKIFAPPTGSNSENEALDLLHIVSTTQDSLALVKFARADRADFQGEDSLAIALYDTLAGAGETYINKESAWRAARLRFETSRDSAFVEYADLYPDAPRAEEALFETALVWRDAGRIDEAQAIFEELLIRYPEGILAAEARLLLDELAIRL